MFFMKLRKFSVLRLPSMLNFAKCLFLCQLVRLYDFSSFIYFYSELCWLTKKKKYWSSRAYQEYISLSYGVLFVFMLCWIQFWSFWVISWELLVRGFPLFLFCFVLFVLLLLVLWFYKGRRVIMASKISWEVFPPTLLSRKKIIKLLLNFLWTFGKIILWNHFYP